MKMKVFYLLALIILILGCWFSTILFGGILNPGTLIALAIAVALIAFSLAPITQRVSHYVWISAGFLILVALCLPTSFFEKFFPPGDAGPLTSSIAFTILIIISLALIITALLLNSCQMLYKKSQAVGKEEDGALQEDARKPDRAVAIILGLSVLLLAKAHHSFYWFMVWDGTIDSLVILWLPITIMAVIFSSFMLYVILPDRTKRAGLLYLLLIPVLVALSIHAGQVDFRQRTEDRAGQVSQRIESYYTKTGTYPEDLKELSPWQIFPLSGPVIIYGQDWCYDGGEDYYRLGYVYRQHWSDPRLIGKIYKTSGELPDLHPICEQEVAILQKSYPDYPYEYWVEDK